MSCWGATKQADGSVVLNAEYADWLSSVLEEACHCGPHIDHADCLSEVEALIQFLKESSGPKTCPENNTPLGVGKEELTMSKAEVVKYLEDLAAREEKAGYKRSPVKLRKAAKAVQRWGN